MSSIGQKFLQRVLNEAASTSVLPPGADTMMGAKSDQQIPDMENGDTLHPTMHKGLRFGPSAKQEKLPSGMVSGNANFMYAFANLLDTCGVDVVSLAASDRSRIVKGVAELKKEIGSSAMLKLNKVLQRAYGAAASIEDKQSK